MKYSETIRSYFSESAEVFNSVAENNNENIEIAGVLCAETLNNGGKILLCGNGGSAGDSQHIAAELVVRLTSKLNRKALPAIALTVNTSVLTACANDYGFEKVFSRQVESLGKKDDVLIAISTSGNSKNVLEAVKIANEMNINTIAFLGGSGGIITDNANISIVIPHSETGRIQEAHIAVGHLICQIVEKELFG
ncbi:SIS domain-containing protein [candidate division KSB1 bacterium]